MDSPANTDYFALEWALLHLRLFARKLCGRISLLRTQSGAHHHQPVATTESNLSTLLLNRELSHSVYCQSCILKGVPCSAEGQGISQAALFSLTRFLLFAVFLWPMSSLGNQGLLESTKSSSHSFPRWEVAQFLLLIQQPTPRAQYLCGGAGGGSRTQSRQLCLVFEEGRISPFYHP